MSKLVMQAMWLRALTLQALNCTYNHSSQKILLPTCKTRFAGMFLTDEVILLPVLLRILPRSPLVFSLPGRRTDFLGWGTWISSIIFIWIGQQKMVLNQTLSSQQIDSAPQQNDFFRYILNGPFQAYQKVALKKNNHRS